MDSIPMTYISRKLPELPKLDDNDILWVDVGVQREGPSGSKQDVLIPRFLPGTMIPTSLLPGTTQQGGQEQGTTASTN